MGIIESLFGRGKNSLKKILDNDPAWDNFPGDKVEAYLWLTGNKKKEEQKTNGLPSDAELEAEMKTEEEEKKREAIIKKSW